MSEEPYGRAMVDTALVTGASRGIGYAVARALAAQGFRLALCARRVAPLEKAAEALAAEGAETATFAIDLREPSAPERLLSQLGQVPEILVNNAGVAPTGRLTDTTDEVLAEVLALHVATPLRLLRAVLPTWRDRDRGCAVQIASTAGLRGFPFTSAYCAAKHGMVGLTRALAEEVKGHDIAVYAVCPGFVDTDITRDSAAAVASRGSSTAEEAFERMAAMNLIGRMHQPNEVAEAVAWLCKGRPDGTVYNLDLPTPGFV